MANERSTPQDKNNDGGRLERAGANATAQGKNQSSGTDTVTVGCKLPTGLMLDITEHGQPPQRFRVSGMNSASVVGGFGITPGVPRDFWEAWLKRNAALSFVKDGFIFALGNTASTQALATERAEMTTKMEPINPAKLVNPKELPGKIEALPEQATA